MIALTRQRWRVVRQLLHSVKDKLVWSSFDMLLSVLISLLFSTKKLPLKSVIPSQTASFHPPPPHPVCHYPTMQLLKTVTASEVFKILSSIPSKTSVLDLVPTSVLKLCPSLFSDQIAHLVNLSFSTEFFHRNSSTPRFHPFSISRILILLNRQTIGQFTTSTIFLRSFNAYSWLAFSLTSLVHQTSIVYNRHLGATTQPRHLLFISLTLYTLTSFSWSQCSLRHHRSSYYPQASF